MSELSGSPPVVIVGAGMAGLTCAVALQEAGIRSTVIEGASTIGGRVGTLISEEGFVLDRGFQVLLTASAGVQRRIDLDSLNLRAFGSGAKIWTGRRLVPAVDPFRHPSGLLRGLTAPLATPADKLRLAREAGAVRRATWDSGNSAARSLGQDSSIAEYLWTQGFSERFVDRVARPFWGGITLDPLLQSSAGLFLSSMRQFVQGRAVLPAEGMAAMPRQLAGRLPANSISLNMPAESVVVEHGRATGVVTGSGLIPAEVVVVATDARSAEGLLVTTLGPLAQTGRPCVTVYLAGPRKPKVGPFLVLDGSRTLTVNHIAPLTEVQPAYGPPGEHLLAAVVIGEQAETTDLERLADQARLDAALMLGDAPGSWRVVDVYQNLFSQFEQPPGFYAKLPSNVTEIPNAYLASELTVDSSYNGAMLSGETAAELILRDFALRGTGIAA